VSLWLGFTPKVNISEQLAEMLLNLKIIKQWERCLLPKQVDTAATFTLMVSVPILNLKPGIIKHPDIIDLRGHNMIFVPPFFYQFIVSQNQPLVDDIRFSTKVEYYP
jgi:hypothetical protein